MMRFFEEHELNNVELMPENRLNSIKCSVMTRIEEDILMKKRRLFKSLVITVAATVAAGVTAVSAVAAPQAQLVEKDGVHYEVYQQDQFNTVAKQIDGYEVEEAPDDSEFTLVSTNEYVDGDYRYVDMLYRCGTGARSSGIWWEGWHKVYYEPDSSESIHIATMYLKGLFHCSEKQNSVQVDEDTIDYKTDKIVTQKYPIINDKEPTYESDCGGAFGSKRYAYIEYQADFEKSYGIHDKHIMRLRVFPDGTAEVVDNYS